MTLYCETQQRGSTIYRCMRYKAVANNQQEHIISYYRFFSDKTDKRKPITADWAHVGNIQKRDIITQSLFADAILVLNEVYLNLLPEDKYKALAVTTSMFSIRENISINFQRGFSLDDGSIVFFYDYSQEQNAIFRNIFKGAW